jgi:hypothetical protein
LATSRSTPAWGAHFVGGVIRYMAGAQISEFES